MVLCGADWALKLRRNGLRSLGWLKISQCKAACSGILMEGAG